MNIDYNDILKIQEQYAIETSKPVMFDLKGSEKEINISEEKYKLVTKIERLIQQIEISKQLKEKAKFRIKFKF